MSIVTLCLAYKERLPRNSTKLGHSRRGSDLEAVTWDVVLTNCVTSPCPFCREVVSRGREISEFRYEVWQGRRDSNPRPAVLETAALPTELRP